jgi:hypothetical protein
MEIIVGSTAAQLQTSWRKPLDLDIWTNEVYTSIPGFDYKTIPKDILKLIDYIVINDLNIATLDSLYTIKCSHLGWDNPNWNKHKLDILHLKHIGAKLNILLYKALVEFWKIELNDKSFLSLKQSKENFFTDNVTYLFDHDWLHEQVSFPNKPTYKQCLKDGEDVLIDQVKFNQMTKEAQLSMFKEEITVIAIERWLVNPKIKDCSWMQSYYKALRKTVTTLTKGWATEFIIMNMEYFTKPEYRYFKYALEATKEKL